MKQIKKYFFTLFLMTLFSVPSLTLAEEITNLYFFHSESCPHCQAENEYLIELEAERDDIKINKFEISQNQKNAELFVKASQILNTTFNGVPVMIIGDQAIIGFSKSITPSRIENLIESCAENTCPDSINGLISFSETTTTNTDTTNEPPTDENINDENQPTNNEIIENKDEEIIDSNLESESCEDMLDIPFLGEINTKTFSLPILAIVLGVIDGFNPCALWALLFLISLLIGMKDRKRMWLLGTAFILSSALVYFGFMVAWLNIILFIGFISLIRILIGVVALIGGSVNIRKGLKKQSGCSVTNSETKRKIIDKTKDFLHEKSFWFSLIGIISLAIVVNLIEILCSAGLPVVFTQVLALNNLSSLQYYLYITLYIFFFMLDDLFIFFAAMITLKLTGVTTKYTKITEIAGGVLMLIIGVLMIFKPEWLMFA